jgi:hypothetical protein
MKWFRRIYNRIYNWYYGIKPLYGNGNLNVGINRQGNIVKMEWEKPFKYVSKKYYFKDFYVNQSNYTATAVKENTEYIRILLAQARHEAVREVRKILLDKSIPIEETTTRPVQDRVSWTIKLSEKAVDDLLASLSKE